MTLSPGTKLGHYEVVEAIGAGGMGEVYRARDTKLGREVAVKVLPAEFSRDKDRLARFEREAKLLAQLNHANIATLHGLEESGDQQFLVMELVPGETLRDKLSRGPIPLDEALALFQQIAEGLEAAHESSVVHRDVKPANIGITPNDEVKILDFGLAKAYAEEASPTGLSSPPTMARGTATGVILGTAPYMSPEQARGKSVDKRTDIWAFGCCLYETLTGRAAFLGDTVSDTIARILKEDPDFDALPTTTPSAIKRLLRRALCKDPHLRLQHMGEARITIHDVRSGGTEGDAIDDRAENKIPWVPVLVTAAVTIVLTGVATSVMMSSAELEQPVDRLLTRSIIPLVHPERLVHDNRASSVAISPDGHYVAYVASRDGSSRLYLRAMAEMKGKSVDGTEDARAPFFSPDSQWLGFYSQQRLMKVSVSGGAPTTLSDLNAGGIHGATWSPDGWIVFNQGGGLGLSRIREDGGEPETLTIPDREHGETTHRLPDVLPGGKAAILTLSTSEDGLWDDASVAVVSLETGEVRILFEGGTNARYSESGHLLYMRGGTLFAVAFDSQALEVKGAPSPILQGVVSSPLGAHAEFALSRQGSLVYAEGGPRGVDRRVVSVNRSGRVEPLIESSRAYFGWVRFSPDGRLLALSIDGANISVWIYDMTRSTLTPFASGFHNARPVWVGDRIAFDSTRAGSVYNIFWQAADGSRPAERLTESPNYQHPGSWSRDHNLLLYVERTTATGWDIWTRSTDRDRAPQLVLQTPFNEESPMVSPDGRWMAYHSDESGQYEVYLCPFPDCRGKSQVSTDGGTEPRWNPNGRELFYRSDDRMMVVTVETHTRPSLGQPRFLFERRSPYGEYDVAPDGQRFVIGRGQRGGARTHAVDPRSELGRRVETARPDALARPDWVERTLHS